MLLLLGTGVLFPALATGHSHPPVSPTQGIQGLWPLRASCTYPHSDTHIHTYNKINLKREKTTGGEGRGVERKGEGRREKRSSVGKSGGMPGL